MKMFLKTKKSKIVTADNKPVVLKGVNFGGWLMMEAYFLYAPNFPEQKFKKEFAAALGKKALRTFEQKFRSSFIQEADFRNVAQMGFNSIRVPFNCKLVERSAYTYDESGVRFLDRVVQWARKYKVWVILDLHAAPGSQNHDWHGDSYGKAEFWKKRSFQDRALALWEFLADRYKDEEYVAGYDLLNESVLKNTKLLNRFYKRLIKRIRSVDRNHILFIEGNNWAQDLKCLDEFEDDNYVLSIHHYVPLDFVFNFVPHLTYPFKQGSVYWNKGTMEKNLLPYKKISRQRGVPIHVGEFGVNARQGKYGEDKWLRDALQCFNYFGFHWNYWTYKAVKNNVFPDGIYSYVENPPWVNRLGPLTGWDTFKLCWKDHQKAMTRSWHTDRFQVNKPILKVLKNAAK